MVPRPVRSATGLEGCAGRGFATTGFGGAAPRGFDTLGAGGLATRAGRGRPPTAFASVERAGVDVGPGIGWRGLGLGLSDVDI